MPRTSAGPHRGRRVDAFRELVWQSAAAQPGPVLFITPTADHLEAFLSAAMTNKQVPVTVVTKEEAGDVCVDRVCGGHSAALSRVNRLADLPGAGGFALYSEPCRAGRDVLVDLLLVSRIC